MILTDDEIIKAMSRGDIVIDEFREDRLGSNSYDVTLGKNLLVYSDLVSIQSVSDIDGNVHPTIRPIEYMNTESAEQSIKYIDVAQPEDVTIIEIPESGMILYPGVLHLGVTNEYTETHNLVPWLDGKSSSGRLGCSIHVTAGRGDIGFCDHWTLEITVVHPLKIYPHMPVGQLTYFEVKGSTRQTYNKKQTVSYAHKGGKRENPVPIPSQLYKKFAA